MDEFKEALLVNGIELQGQEKLVLQMIQNAAKGNKVELSSVYKNVLSQLLNVKKKLRGKDQNSLSRSIGISEFETKDLVDQKIVTEAEQDAKTIHYQLQVNYDKLVESVKKLETFGVNTATLHMILKVFSEQMVTIVQRTLSAIERKDVVEDLLKRLKEDYDEKKEKE